MEGVPENDPEPLTVDVRLGVIVRVPDFVGVVVWFGVRVPVLVALRVPDPVPVPVGL